MEKIKPYMFWFVCGALLLILVILSFFWNANNAQGKSVETVVKSLNSKYRVLAELGRRAGNVFEGKYDIENTDKFNDIEEDYLITNKWSTGLRKTKGNIESQITSIKERLLQSSSVIDVPVSDSKEKFTWYDAYKNKTVSLLKMIFENNAIEIDSYRRGSSSAKRTLDALETNKSLRETVGLFTKGADYPKVELHEKLSKRFAIVSFLSKTVISIKETSFVNKSSSQTTKTKPCGIKIKNISWTDGPVGNRRNSSNRNSAKNMIPGGSSFSLTLLVTGTPASLLGLTKKIESSSSPIVVINGMKMTNKQSQTSSVDSFMLMELQMSVLRFDKDALSVLVPNEEEEE